MKNYIKIETEAELDRVIKCKRCNLYMQLSDNSMSHFHDKSSFTGSLYNKAILIKYMLSGVVYYTERPSKYKEKIEDSINFINSL